MLEAMERRRARGAPSRLVIGSWIGNLVGALVAFSYFRFIDDMALTHGATMRLVIFSLVAFAALITLGYRISGHWTGPLGDVDAPRELVRRRAIQLPVVIAGITFVGWLLAGLLWGVVWPILEGTFRAAYAGRQVFGISIVSGLVTTVFVFLYTEHQWRKEIDRFFPEGDLSAVRGTPRLTVRLRLLLVLLMVGVVPLLLLGVMAYRRTMSLIGMDPDRASAMVQGMLPVIAFLAVVPIVAAVGLSVFVANSVAAPLRRLEASMAEVAEGNLDARCPVVSNDEIGAVAEGFNRMLVGLRERDFVKETFGKYVTREIRDEILAGRISLEGEAREVTILFCDLRDFTPWVEASPPREVLRDLNDYFAEMNAAIRAEGGLVVQFIGDEIEAVFGAPVVQEAHAERAVRAAREMRRRLAAWNARRQAEAKPPLRHGIGIHTGTVLAGNVGSAERLSYALVGDAVNLASRIQGLTKDFGVDILASSTTRARLGAGLALEPLPATRVKGRSEEVEVFRVV
jgi:adenylate cyclase